MVITETGPLLTEPRELLPGWWYLPGFADSSALAPVLAAVCRSAPVRQMQTPRGFTMSVAMTSCGTVGWIADRRGYRYSPEDPVTGRPWPAMPVAFLELAGNARRPLPVSLAFCPMPV